MSNWNYHSDEYYFNSISNNSNNNNNQNNYNDNSSNYNNKNYKKKKNYNNNYYANNSNNYYYYGSKTYGNDYNYNNSYNNYNYNYNNKYDYYDNYEPKKKSIDFYINKINKDKVSLPELTQNLINDLKNNKITCMICELGIKKDQSIWSCNICYSIIHLNCITEWIKKNNPNFNEKSKDENSKLSWTCPHCKSLYENNKLPIYNCYCGKYYEAVKEKNKYLDPDLVPHGCGLLCKEKICPHIKYCPLPCHPGPHVQCKEQVKILCYCGKNSKIVPCSYESETDFCCNEICGKQLSCGKKNHICKAVCHTGSCDKFLKKGKCYECIAENRNKLYEFLKNSVEKKLNQDCYEAHHLTHFASCLTAYIFNGELPCKEHTVAIKTDQCLKLLLRLFEVSGNSLLENLKKFIPICDKVVENSCSCHSKKTKAICFKLNYPEDILDFLGVVRENPIEKCNRVCKTLKNCGIHKCDRICCSLRNVKIRNYSTQDPNGYHLCFKICGKPLECGKHNCENYCHKGNCKPCAYIVHEGEIKCTCGKTTKKAPFLCGTKLECPYPCSIQRKCGHPCPLTCHEGSCPPCEVPVQKKCRCGKDSFKNIKCGDTKVLICNNICDCILPCGVHFCQLKCHIHDEEYDKNYVCNMICQRQLLKCEHLCKEKCHGESECNEYKCDEKIFWYCKCKTNKKTVICGEFKKNKEEFEKEHKDEQYVLPCNDECVKNERLRSINEAFQGLKNISESKMKILYPNCNLDGSEDVKKEHAQKYYNDAIWMAMDNFDIFLNVEKELYKCVSKAYKEKQFKRKEEEDKKEEKKEEKKEDEKKEDEKANEEENKNEENKEKSDVKKEEKKEEKKEKTYLIPIEEDAFDDLNEWLVIYHGVKPKKVYKKDKTTYEKSFFLKLSVSQLQSFYYQKYRLSLIALLLKNNLFITQKKYKVYHPFKYSIEIRNYKSNKEYEELNKSIMNLGKLKPGDFYLYEFKKFYFYLHFFNKELGKEIFAMIQKKQYEFNEVYEHLYYNDDEPTEAQMYKYLRDEPYMNYLLNGYDKKYTGDKKNLSKYKKKNSDDEEDEDSSVDEDGFTIVKKKK